ncbi:MAG: PDDEXK nuclease domain-containing protein [Candidatus Marinimicrobia bacterium]|nr:PDDEXK nuclease domain-containing protein [Candidatus Neomarinimicrobiota bacterium]
MWKNKVGEIATDLKHEFPDIRGFSRRNIYAMRQWYLLYSSEFSFMPQVVAQIPWGHNRLIISKTKDVNEGLFYTKETIRNNWSRDNLEIQINDDLYYKKSKIITNFDLVLPKDQSKLAKNILKDPFNFDFLGLENDALEKTIEDELVKHITKFLLELGKGFAFIGRQYKIEISETDYFIDLLFYHLELRCFIVIELKAGKFKPEFAGKLNFYLSAVDSQLKKEMDNHSIGILLCKKKDKIEVEYALRDIKKPLGISEYKLTEAIPSEFRTKLPSIEELEKNLFKKNKINN